jgi:hypothetical protein
VVAGGDCDRCILRSKCAYPYIFETPVPDGSRRMASLEHAPHPFVIEPPLDERTQYGIGDPLSFGLLLVGRAIDYLPYFIFAFEHLGERCGIGKAIEVQGESGTWKAGANGGARGKVTVEAVEVLNGSGDGIRVYDGQSKALCGELHPQTLREVVLPRPLGDGRSEGCSSSPSVSRSDPLPLTLHASRCLSLSFLTPTRLIFDRHLAAVPEFHILIRNLLRRLSNLAYFHCDSDLDLDFRGLVDAAQEVKLIENRTRWHDWERYSARQDARLKMGGVVGETVYEGNLEPFAPLLALGEVLHVGKGTGMGLGRYRLVVSAADAAAGEVYA